MQTALGFRAHSGWAAMVAVAGTVDKPRVLDRSRIVIADAELSGSRQPYHAAAELPFAEAEVLVRTAIESSRALAREAIGDAIRSLEKKGHTITRAAILKGSARPLPDLRRILAAHPLIHTAEGEMFRDALAWAAGQCGLQVTMAKEKELDPDVLRRLDSLGRLIGPPWTQDQKYATLAALMASGTGGRSSQPKHLGAATPP